MATAPAPVSYGRARGLLVASGIAALAGVAGAGGAGPAAGAAVSRPAARQVVEHGTVIARDLARRTLVIAGAGVAHTLRLASPRSVSAARLGSDLRAVAVPLADGTDEVVSVRTTGESRRVVVRATVVASSRGRLVLAAGGSVFAVGGAAAHAASRNARLASRAPAPGEVVKATLSVTATAVQPASIQAVGQASLVDLEGALSGVSPASIVVTVSAGAITTVGIPASLSLPPAIAVGDQVEVVAAYRAGTFSLVTIVDDTLAASTAGSSSTAPAPSPDGSSESVEIEGVVVAAPAGSGGGVLTGTASSLTSTATTGGSAGESGLLVIQPGDNAAPVSVAVPPGFVLPALAAGARVKAVAAMSGGVLTLTRLVVRSPGTDAGQSATGQSPSGSPGQPASCAPTGSSPGGRGDHAVGADGGGSSGSSCAPGGTGSGKSSPGTSAGPGTDN